MELRPIRNHWKAKFDEVQASSKDPWRIGSPISPDGIENWSGLGLGVLWTLKSFLLCRGGEDHERASKVLNRGREEYEMLIAHDAFRKSRWALGEFPYSLALAQIGARWIHWFLLKQLDNSLLESSIPMLREWQDSLGRTMGDMEEWEYCEMTILFATINAGLVRSNSSMDLPRKTRKKPKIYVEEMGFLRDVLETCSASKVTDTGLQTRWLDLFEWWRFPERVGGKNPIPPKNPREYRGETPSGLAIGIHLAELGQVLRIVPEGPENAINWLVR